MGYLNRGIFHLQNPTGAMATLSQTRSVLNSCLVYGRGRGNISS